MTRIITSALIPQNKFSTSLLSACSATDTIIFVNAVPTSTMGFLTIDEGLVTEEVIFYSSVGSNFVTCPSVSDGRGVFGAAVGHSTNAVVKMKVVAEYYKALQNGTAISSLPQTLLSNPNRFSAYNSTTQSLPSGSHKVIFDTEQYDPSSSYDNVTNNRYTAQVAGLHSFNVALYISSATGNIAPQLFKNNAAFVNLPVTQNTGNADVIMGGTFDMVLALSDFVEVFINVASGTFTLQGLAGVAPISSYFQGRFIST